jgi:hypothetical protein
MRNFMGSQHMLGVVSGALGMGYAVVALFFLRFWRDTGDRLFMWFSIAFIVLLSQRLALSLTQEWMENTVWLYGLRLAAFVIILVAIIDKNRSTE